MNRGPTLLGVGLLSWTIWVPIAGAAPVEVRLADEGQARQAVVIGTDASKRVQAAAGDLARYLGRIGGAAVEVQEGDGSSGLAVGVFTDFPALATGVEFDPADRLRREEYLLRTHERGAWLIGATELAVEHAVWDFLYRLGYRQFFPGERWEVVPSSPDLRVAVDSLEKPAYHARRIWYGYGPLPSRIEAYRHWSARNRVVQGFSLHSSHYYEAIIAANREAFAANPEFYALVGGERRMTGGDIKFCISNPGLRQLVIDHALREMRANPDRDSISMDPSDGGNWCECQPCAAMGSISDRVLTLANQVAEAIKDPGSGNRYVGILAYSYHSPPPSVEVHPNVIVTATAGFLRGGYTLDEVIRGWQAKGAVMGVYDYFSVMPWDWDMPGRARAARPSYMAETIPEFYDWNVRFHDAESSDNWGPNGLGYYAAARILWDLSQAERVEDIVEDFLQRAFGPAREPLAEFYRLIDGGNRPLLSQNLVGRMYRSLAEGRRRAAGDDGALGRIDDLILYTRYVELKLQGDQLGALRHGHRIRDSGMVHFRAMWPWRHAHRLELQAIPDEWLQESVYGPAETVALLEAGIEANPVVEFSPVAFSQQLVPATPLNLPEVPMGNLGDIYQGHGRQGGFDLYTWFDEPGEMNLRVTGGLIPHYRDRGHVKLSLFSPRETTLKAVAHDDSVPPDGQERTIGLRTPDAGLHRLELRDGGDASRIFWEDGWPMVLPCSPEAGPPVNGAWSLYFYVPKGTPTVAGYANHGSGRLLDGAGNEMLDFTDLEVPGYFRVAVAEGQDGQLWRVDRSRAQLMLMTVPPYLARNEKELLLPREVVEADRE